MLRCGTVVVKKAEAAINKFPRGKIEPIALLASVSHAGLGQRTVRRAAGGYGHVHNITEPVVAKSVTNLRRAAAVAGDAKAGHASLAIGDPHRHKIIVVKK